MFFSSSQELYTKGQVLTAASLNENFALDRFIIYGTACERWSDGIISGLITHVSGESLELSPGIFRMQGRIGWLRKPLKLDVPESGKTCRLWLEAGDGSDQWQLVWKKKDAPASGLCLCQLSIGSRTLLEDSWLLTGKQPTNAQEWQNNLKKSGDILLEYAMAASLGKFPTILPQIQQNLARLALDPGMRLWLGNGLWQANLEELDWEKTLQELARLLEAQNSETEKSGSWRGRNLATIGR